MKPFDHLIDKQGLSIFHHACTKGLNLQTSICITREKLSTHLDFSNTNNIRKIQMCT